MLRCLPPGAFLVGAPSLSGSVLPQEPCSEPACALPHVDAWGAALSELFPSVRGSLHTSAGAWEGGPTPRMVPCASQRLGTGGVFYVLAGRASLVSLSSLGCLGPPFWLQLHPLVTSQGTSFGRAFGTSFGPRRVAAFVQDKYGRCLRPVLIPADGVAVASAGRGS